MTPVPDSISEPIPVEISGRRILIDKLVDYPVCNDNWSGTVYFGCDAKVATTTNPEGDASLLFFKGCDLKVMPNTVVYVAAHNDAPFYKGCSCHTNEMPNKE
jgi:hypothetical protein